MKKALMLAAGLLVAYALAAAPVAHAQVPTGNIDGQVRDATGVVLPGVTVEVAGPALMGTRVATTGAQGRFRFVALPPSDEYTVTFSIPGFATLLWEEIKVTLNTTTTLTPQMQLATLQETITVIGESPVVDVRSSNVGVNVREEMLQEVPNARDVWVVLEEIPGIVMNKFNVGGSESGQQSRFSAGAGPSQNAYNFDGIDITDMAAIGAATYFPYDAFQEVQVSTSAHNAEVAAPGVFLNIVTRSGSNTFHGLEAFYWEGPRLQSNNIDDALRAQGITEGDRLNKYLDYTLSFSGPVLRDKLSFYTTHQRQQPERFPIGFFRADGSPGIDSTALIHYIGKLDWQINPSNKLTVNWFNSTKDRPWRTGAAYDRSGPGTLRKQLSSKNIPQIHWTSFIGDRSLLSLSYGRMNMNFPLVPDSDNQSLTSLYEYRSTLRTDTPPLPNWQRGYHQSYYRYNLYLRTRDQVNGTFSYSKPDWAGADHHLKFGFNVFKFESVTDEFSPGTQGLRVGFRYGLPYNIRLENHPQKFIYSEKSGGFYAQDTVTLDRLTLNLGLRGDAWEVYLPEQTSTDTAFCGMLGDRYPSFCGRTFPEQRNMVNFFNVAARLGLVYDLTNDGHTAVKANFARYYNQVSNSMANYANPNGYTYMYFRWSDANGDNMWQPGEERTNPYSVTQAAENQIDPNLKQPFTDEWVFGVDREVMEDLSMSASVTLRRDKRLMEDVAMSIPYSAYTERTFTDAVAGTFTAFELDPKFVGMTESWMITNPETANDQPFENTYRAVTVKATKRLSRNWHVLGSYTYSATKGWRTDAGDDASGLLDDPNADLFAFGRPFYDRPHLIKVSGSTILPYDVHIGGFLRLQSGEPYARLIETPVRLNQGFVTVRIEPVGSQRYPTVKTLDLRASKRFQIGGGRIEAMLDVFNLFNSNSAISLGEEIRENLGDIRQILPPRIARFGMKFSF